MPTKKNFLGGNQNYNPKNGEYEPSLVGKNGKVVKDADGDGKTREGWDFDEESKTYTSKDGEVFSEKEYQKKFGGEQTKNTDGTPDLYEPDKWGNTAEDYIAEEIDYNDPKAVKEYYDSGAMGRKIRQYYPDADDKQIKDLATSLIERNGGDEKNQIKADAQYLEDNELESTDDLNPWDKSDDIDEEYDVKVNEELKRMKGEAEDKSGISDAISKANESKSKMNVTDPRAKVSTSSSGGAIQDILSKYQEEASKIDPSDERALNRLKGKYEGRYEKELEAAGITDIDQLESKYHKTNEGYIDLDETGWNAKKETLKKQLDGLYRNSDIDDVIKMREEGYKAAQKYYGGKVPESVKGGIKEYLEKTNPGEYQTDYIKTDATVDDFAKAWNSGSFDSILIDEGGLDSDPRNVILEYVESQGYKYDPKTGDLVKTAKQKTKPTKK